MKLINTDGMAFIGPGSEWFWTAVSGLVLAITFIAIYRQLRLQASAGAIEQMESLQRDWISERMSRSRLRVQLALHGGVDPATLPDQAAGDIANFWERLGYLVRAGHVDRDLVYGYMGNLIRLWWACLAPHVQLTRDRYGDSAISEEFMSTRPSSSLSAGTLPIGLIDCRSLGSHRLSNSISCGMFFSINMTRILRANELPGDA